MKKNIGYALMLVLALLLVAGVAGCAQETPAATPVVPSNPGTPSGSSNPFIGTWVATGSDGYETYRIVLTFSETSVTITEYYDGYLDDSYSMPYTYSGTTAYVDGVAFTISGNALYDGYDYYFKQ